MHWLLEFLFGSQGYALAIPFPVIAAGASLAVSAARNYFGGKGDRRGVQQSLKNLEALRPQIRQAGQRATTAAGEAVTRFQNFDAMAGFDEELAARVRQPLANVRDVSNAAGRFRSGAAAESEQRVVAGEAANLLTARQRLQLEGYAGLAGAASNYGQTALDFFGAESELESGLIDFRQGRQNARNQEMAQAFQLFLKTQGIK